jgi:hypothetical protein
MDPVKLHHALVEKGTAKARTAAYAATTDRLRKQVRAKHVVDKINAGATLGKAEHLALLEPEYIEACERAEKAEGDAGVAAVEYASAQAWFEAWRTLESTKRAEMQIR